MGKNVLATYFVVWPRVTGLHGRKYGRLPGPHVSGNPVHMLISVEPQL